MKQILIRKGEVLLEDVPAPQVEAGTVVVRVDHSCISIGTEMGGLRASGVPLWKRALQQPEKVRKVIEMVATQGLAKTRSLVEGSVGAAQPTGYSAAGTVVAVGDGIADLRPGDRVACAGSLYAHHAHFIRVPRNLVVPMPDSLGFAAACTVTLGAIALQGVRRAQPTLGESFVVIGLGILGQLTVQMLQANGCRAIGLDLDRARIDLALSLGMDAGVLPDDGDAIEHALRLTGGIGADGVIITAATPSDEIVSTAFRMCRRKGRVVLVGDVGLDLQRADFYAKELDFLVSTSYGPGRYDANYEEHGLDYPIGYVRWTENRNLAEYLRLVASGRVKVDALITRTFPFAEAQAAYESLKAPGAKPLMVQLSYPPLAESAAKTVALTTALPAPGEGRVRVGVVGAGNFAKGTHLPNLKSLPERFELHSVMSRTGYNAVQVGKQFGARLATSDYAELLADDAVDAVIITTRHDLHTGMALQALNAGKHVLVEKPLALDASELASIRDFYAARDGKPAPLLLTGYNRRFSPYARRIRDAVAGRSNPMLINYRMNAGHLPLDHWVHGKEGGGRNIGEACHIYDLFLFLTGAAPVDIVASCVRPATAHYGHTDNFVATVAFDDGSLASLTYTALGARDFPKESMEVFVDGKVFVLDDYKSLRVAGAPGAPFATRTQEKGQREELEAFARAIREGGDWPIPLQQQLQASEISFAVEDQLRNGRPGNPR